MKWMVLLFLSCTMLLLTACSRQGDQRASLPTAVRPMATQVPQLEATKGPPATVVPQTPTVQPTPTDVGSLADPDDFQADPGTLEAKAEHAAKLAAVLASDRPILLLDKLDDAADSAQKAAADDEGVKRISRDSLTGEPLRTEVFLVRPTLPSDLTETTERCAQTSCYRVELYNYPQNLSIVAIVAIDDGAETVLVVGIQHDTQPEIPAHLADLAAQIAANAPEVHRALGFNPTVGQAIMPNVKTALNGSRCERSRHLCVAPTFILEDRALWAIVDLTEGRLVGTRWTDLGSGGGVLVTEQTIQDSVIMATYCEQAIPVNRNGWDLQYMLTSSDGLAVVDAEFAGAPTIRSIKLPDWHVSYSGTDGFGYSDATGCPMFSTASVVAFNGPALEDIVDSSNAVVGFAIVQDFRSELWPLACNYRYEQRYEFYADGRFRVAGANLGQGCGNNGTYRPILRIDLADPTGQGQTFAEWEDGWSDWVQEGWTIQDDKTSLSPDGYQFRIKNEDGSGYYLEPNLGQFGDESRGDNAFTYATVYHPDEGEADLITIGSCCNEDYQQGPDKFLTPAEPLNSDGSDIVMWHVAQMENDDTPGREYCWTKTSAVEGNLETNVFACYFGPMFVPIGSAIDE